MVRYLFLLNIEAVHGHEAERRRFSQEENHKLGSNLDRGAFNLFTIFLVVFGSDAS
jgi:hypothetical protein